MYNYIMLIMNAIDEDRQKEYQSKHNNKSQQQIRKEKNISLFQKILGEDVSNTLNTGKKLITIEVTPEDMEKAKKEREEREKAIKERRLGITKKGRPLPSRVKSPSSSS